MIGGGAVSEMWCQIHADVLNREVRQVANPIRANARGAALLASLALGSITVEEISQQTTVERVFYPDPSRRALYDSMYGEYGVIYKQNKAMWKRLNAHV